MITLHKAFPTLIAEFKEVLFPDQCDAIISSLDKQKFIKYGALTGDAVTNFAWGGVADELPPDVREILHMKIQTCIDSYANESGFARTIVENTWVSIQRPHSKLKKHSHPGSEISGVLYLKADEKSSPLYFYNPNPFINFVTLRNKNTEYSSETIKFVPTTGSIILFPSWLSHGSGDDENMSEERIIFSFNTRSNENYIIK